MMQNQTPWTPPGTVLAAETRYYDQKTYRRLSRTETAAAWAREYRRTHGGEWPAIKQIMINLDCGYGTAQRALSEAKAAGHSENIHMDKSVC